MTFILLLAAATGTAFADLDALDRQIERFTGAETGAVGGAQQPLDRRMRLRACASTPSLSWRSSAQDSILIECPDAGSWRLYVAVRRASTPVAATAAVKRGDAISITVRGAGFTVSQPGEALEDGVTGEWVRVRAAAGRTSQPMQGRIEHPGLVSILIP
jgi:flagellar basal body P-ring formation protein FlgA